MAIKGEEDITEPSLPHSLPFVPGWMEHYLLGAGGRRRAAAGGSKKERPSFLPSLPPSLEWEANEQRELTPLPASLLPLSPAVSAAKSKS